MTNYLIVVTYPLNVCSYVTAIVTEAFQLPFNIKSTNRLSSVHVVEQTVDTFVIRKYLHVFGIVESMPIKV